MRCIVVNNSVADPGTGAFLTPGSEIQDEEKIPLRIWDEQTGSYFEILVTIFWVKVGT